MCLYNIDRNKKHNLADIIVLSILAVICGAESWDSIEEFGKARVDFLKKILYLPNGIPSHDTINRVFSMLKPDTENEIVEKGHGRIETRNCKVYNQIQLLEDLEKWSDLKSVIQITSEREINEKKTKEIRFYISSLNDEARAFNKYIRMHWGVENSLHWTLDMTFREDEQRKRDKNSAQNFAIVRKIVLNLLKQEDSKKLSLRTKRLKAGWDNNFLLKILKI